MKTTLARALLLLAATLWFTEAYADCIYKGKSYPTGTRLGGLTCQADGTWK